ncbi:restriction endonuclease subunit S [Sphaerospermopsis sp. LEGE 00249]|uniref:restriction endonuclease subunit S n=1 Tax=Sphaerospermopsis sp. LEGE 00249 TaxID=1380707 RepID=UPI00164DCF4C|nr:restriction endonuclease subunit S [Sphaerospermopsis sp. LEGE 00249]MBC5797009.1 restriction endonuclease subunit S [Sphaerospermopsis sp. LEGE 00249]
MDTTKIKAIISHLGFIEKEADIFQQHNYIKTYPNHKNYVIKVNFATEKIDYGDKITVEDETTSNFSQPENFVVLECVNRLLEKGYEPQHLVLERKFPLGRTGKSGKSDISVFDREEKSLIIIECKTWGKEYEKEKNRMIENGGQLFSYLQQDKNTRFLCLYTSQLNDDGLVVYENAIIQIKDREETLRLLAESKEEIKSYKEAKTAEELYTTWKENFNCYFAPNGIFDPEVQAYNPEYIPIKKKDLQPFTEGEGRKLFNQFEEILRHNNISDKSNAFNRILSLILCKIVDEQKNENDITDFQIIESKDTPEQIQERLQKLYAKGMREFLKEEIVYYSEQYIDELVRNFPIQTTQERLKQILRELKFYSNNEFAFKEVHNEKLFLENAKVLNEIITLLQYKKFRYFYNDNNGLKYQKQYLGDFFEQLLDAGYKQSEGQFFTPLPIAKFIVKSLPLREIIEAKLNQERVDFLPYLIDYACGSGHFLVEAIEEIQNIVDTIKPEFTKDINRYIRQYQESSDWAEKFIFGIEKDYRLARTAKVACFMNGDGQANIFFGDGLEDYNERERQLAPSYDVVIANPPYSIHGFKPHALKLKDKYTLFESLTDSSSEIEALFIERTAQLLHTGGKTGIILPSSILNNIGIYARAREIILQNFLIKAIVELGSNAFMATGTNTIVLFMEKRESRWKHDYNYVAEDYIINNRERPHDFIDSESLFRSYVDYLGLDFDDYKTFVGRSSNDAIKATEWYQDYRHWFDNLTDVKNLQKRKDFKSLTKEEQQERIERLFYEKVLPIEKEKFYYYLLSYEQEFIIVKSANDIQSNREFLGYEFKKGRQAGMVVYRDGEDKDKTALYDEDNLFNSDKVNYYIYQSFLGNIENPADAVKDYISLVDLVDCIDFKRVEFEKQISLSILKKHQIITKWPLVRLGSVAQIESGGTPSTNKSEYWDGNINWATLVDTKQKYLYSTQRKITQTGLENSSAKLLPINTVILSTRATIGDVTIAKVVTCTNQGYKNFICDESKIHYEYLYYILKAESANIASLATGLTYPEISKSELSKYRIPLPTKEVQEQIIQEIEVLENREQELRDNIENYKNQMKVKVDEIYTSNSSRKPIGNLCLNVQYGISKQMNTEDKGYKIFRMNEIIEGKMFDGGEMKYVDISPEEFDKFKLAPGDILFNRTNSIELVGKTGIFTLEGDYCFASYLVRLKIDTNQANPFFVNFIMNSNQFQQVAKEQATKSINQANINATKLKSIEIPVPSLSIQNKIATEIQNIEAEIYNLETELNIIPQQKEAILQKYL